METGSNLSSPGNPGNQVRMRSVLKDVNNQNVKNKPGPKPGVKKSGASGQTRSEGDVELTIDSGSSRPAIPARNSFKTSHRLLWGFEQVKHSKSHILDH